MTQDCTASWLIRTWRDFFGDVAMDTNSDFFALGGNSLTAIRLLARVEEAFGPDTLDPDSLFEDGRVAQLAAVIDRAVAQRAALGRAS